MRAKEFIVERKKGKISKRYRTAAPGINTYSDAEKANSDYVQYRLGLALACSNGEDPISMNSKSWFGKQKTTQPYTELEQKMLDQCYKLVGAAHKDLSVGKSQELPDTNTHSPVNDWTKNP